MECPIAGEHQVSRGDVARVGAAFDDNLSLVGVESMDDDVGCVPVVMTSQNTHEQRASIRKQLGAEHRHFVRRRVGLDEELGVATTSGHFENPRWSLSEDDATVDAPTGVEEALCGAEDDGSTSGHGDLLQKTFVPEADPVAVGRKEGTASECCPRNGNRFGIGE